jgi:prevent-host-death family protein
LEESMAKEVTVSVTDFKAHCLRLLKDVADRRVRVTITRRGRPIARVVNVEAKPLSLHGCMKGTFEIVGDIIAPPESEWDANRD